MIFSFRRHEKYNFVKDKKKNKLITNGYNKKNYHPYILHNNIKNYRNNNRYCNNNCVNDCSLNCPTKNNIHNPNKNSKLYYEKIYKGLDFNPRKNLSPDEKKIYCENESYKIPTIKNRTTMGNVEPKCLSNINDCDNNENIE